MNFQFWCRGLFRSSFSHIFSCQLEEKLPHRVHFFGEVYSGSDPFFNSSTRKIIRHSMLDLHACNIEDLARVTLDESAQIDENGFVAQSISSYCSSHGGVQLLAACSSKLPRQFAHRNQSDTEKLPTPLRTGVLVREVGPISLRIEFLLDGQIYARHRTQAYPDPRSLTFRAIPNDDFVFITGSSEFLWIEVKSGRVLLRGGI